MGLVAYGGPRQVALVVRVFDMLVVAVAVLAVMGVVVVLVVVAVVVVLVVVACWCQHVTSLCLRGGQVQYNSIPVFQTPELENRSGSRVL